MAEFVGKSVRKEFKGFGVFAGVVNSYDSSTGFFEVVYEDGDSEELEFGEIASLLEGSGTVVNDQSGVGIEGGTRRAGRKPRKRRRVGSGNNSSSNLMSISCLKEEDGEEILGQDRVDSRGFSETYEKECGVGEKLKENLSMHGNLNLNTSGGNGVRSDILLNLNDGFDLNEGLNLDDGLNLNDGFNLNVDSEGHLNKRKNACIDLNLDANGDFEEDIKDGDLGVGDVVTQKREHCFDLNLGFDEEIKNSDTECEGRLGEDTSFHIVDKTQKLETGGIQMEAIGSSCADAVGDPRVWSVEEVQKGTGVGEGLNGVDSSGAMHAKDFLSSEVQLKEKLPEATTPLDHSYQGNSGSTGKERKRRKRRKLTDNITSGAETVLRRSSSREAGALCTDNAVLSGATSLAHNEISPLGVMDPNEFYTPDGQLKEELPGGTPLDHGYQGNSGSMCKERNSRKRRKLLDNAASATERVLRRSSRRLAATLSDQNHVSSRVTLLERAEAQPSPAVSAVLEEKPATSGREESEAYSVLPSKLQLPPSSGDLNLDGVPIFDLFSVYSCLRSFSTLLYLSPFGLENFVAALKCKVPNLLFDSIHVSLLQTLRKHLEFLSEEDSQSASNCLRSLNWDFLDVITWPMFMGEYLLMHGSELKSGFDLCKMKLFESDYYKQPASVKIEILRCLCDDVIEVEAIRSELNRRTLAIELNIDTERNVKIEASKRRTPLDVSGGSCLTEEVVDEVTDWNSDECRLCKMDGSLICCDGCPEAYHLKCVGVANSLLPEGDWYCPECVIDKDKPWLKLGKSLRGAELLGVDPYGRFYYSSCGYLLVSEDSCDNGASYHYYSANDLTFVIQALRSADTFYSQILCAISNKWNISVKSKGAKSCLGSHDPTVCLEVMKGQMPSSHVLPLHLAPSKTYVRDEIIDETRPPVNSTGAQYSGNADSEVSALVNSNPVTVNNFMNVENPLTSSEGSAETSQATRIQNCAKTGLDSRSAGISNDSENQGKILSVGDSSLTSTDLDAVAGCGHKSSLIETRKGEPSQGLLATSYVNCYSFARTASLVVEELTGKSSDKINVASIKSLEDIISAQLKAISKKATKFSWPNIQNLNADARKEKCGWCFSCRAPEDDRDCFFNMNDSAPDSASEITDLGSKRNKKGHLIDVMCYILCLEDRLRGFLLGPWLNPQFTKIWRNSVVKASEVASLKHLFLLLESNLRRLALSAEWLKQVDSVATLGSASHVVTSSLRVSSKHGISRKRSRCSVLEPSPSSKAATGLGLFWWRGGRLSCKLFNWKVLPRSLASKAARQAGYTKIPGVTYSDSSEFSSRSRYVAWRAAVETSRSVEQLALQVRELDANIRWDDIENTNLLSKMDQFRKSVKPFKKVIIRRKCTEGTVVKYLLDFGKRRIIPDIVVTHGSMVEESSSGRKKYWLEESHVPLYLLKTFEERKIARKSSQMGTGKPHWNSRVTKKSLKKRGFSYLFAKAERSQNYLCGHCNKDVLIREAVSCQYCEGFFHKRHVKKSARAIASKCTYTCHKCQDGNCVKVEAKKGKSQSRKSNKGSTVCRVLRSNTSKKACKNKKPAQLQKNKKVTVVLPLRRSARRMKIVALQNKKVGGRKKRKGKQIKSRKVLAKQPVKCAWKKKRTQAYHTYWLNGLLLSRKPNDDRVKNFRSKNLIAPLEQLTASFDQPKCSLCHEHEFSSTFNYVSCDICGDWFHGDAIGLTVENIGNLVGFRCHQCRTRTPPVCPHLHQKTIYEAQLGELINEAGGECPEEVSNVTVLPTEVLEEHKFHMEEESKAMSLDYEYSHKDQESGTVRDANQLDAENGHLPTSEEHKREAIQISNEKSRRDASMESSEHASLVEKITDIGTGDIGAVTASVDAAFPLSQTDADGIDTEMASSRPNNMENNLVKTAILGLPEHKTFVDSSELPCQAVVPSGEKIDGKEKML